MEERDGIEVFRRKTVIKDAEGKELTLEPLSISDYGSAREESLDYYRRQQIKTWTKNADLIPDEHRQDWIREAFEKAQKLTYEDLPRHDIKERDADTGASVHLTDVEYALWWMSTNPKGMLYSLWLSARKDPGQHDITVGELEKRFMAGGALDQGVLDQAANALGGISQPRIAGNGDASPGAGQTNKRRRRRQRK